MARNRKRGRDRRPRQPGDVSSLATARGERVDENAEPLHHAAPDAELADAQLALGRPELAEVPDEDELEAFEEASNGAGDGRGGLGGTGGGDGGLGGGEVALPGRGGGVPAHRESALGRLVNFLRGSWRELQRVQWPTRPQVFQATGVVIGFVIVAGIFLGLADLVSEHLVNFILK